MLPKYNSYHLFLFGGKMNNIRMLCSLVLLIILFDITFARTRSFNCPEEDIDKGCKHPLSCLYPNPNNCQEFIQCDDAGRVYYKKCTGGLHWNDIIKNCDEPRRVKCKVRGY
ncbi:hypothetical protein I4U23_005815 [Adineta vaga]|nr:hypothetical protein I4U23_005815 [Adineta vaga]